jgi:hypothetical protein
MDLAAAEEAAETPPIRQGELAAQAERESNSGLLARAEEEGAAADVLARARLRMRLMALSADYTAARVAAVDIRRTEIRAMAQAATALPA